MGTEQLSSEIRELNLSYLMLAQAMIRADKPQAVFRLGLPEDVCDLITGLSTQQLVRAASRNQLLCAMRFPDEMVWGLLTDRHAPSALDSTASRLHASVLMAGAGAAA
ncbi:flagellar transcriptional regulator FlhD [Ramlibacter sp. MMS24-I3-19]|uniref:flagellar transcriptional regulator FlhD n=1 Tax=Ramlibacter sp. MMS24-I3-19 TaxID=3416606 RepID=UPI003CFD22A5